MKLGRYRETDGRIKIGVVVDQSIHQIDSAFSMIELISNFDSWREAIEGAVEDRSSATPLSAIEMLAPIERPGKIMGIGFNYADHADEAGIEIPSDQIWFSKATTAINGPFARIELPRASKTLDYEAELVVVIGKRCRHVAPEQANEVIFGYCAGNDVSVREWQFKTSQFMLGKSFDTHAPIGPWIVTRDSINPKNLDISLTVNGSIRQRSNTRNLIFDFGAMISHLTTVMTLEPGDLIFTGTPSGVGAVMTPPQWLVAGDVVRVEIEEIGAIENQVVAE